MVILPKFQSKQEGYQSEEAQEVLLVWQLHNELVNKLKKYNLLQVYNEIEMPLQIVLMNMELNGMSFDRGEAMQLWNKAEDFLKTLENSAHQSANRKFNLCSTNDIKKIKEILKIKSDIKNEHPFLVTVRNWRKIQSLKCRTLNQLMLGLPDKFDGRIYFKSCTWTNTGRVILYDPCLQHIPRDFTVGKQLFSPRSSFKAARGNLLLSADFCQLELRILAHFSKDSLLISMIKSDVDVFISIASGWYNVEHTLVNEEMRHQTKQICYGILYGMGDRALGETLGVTITEAAEMAAQFRLSYPGVGKFIEKTINECRSNGYVTTITGRIRRLPLIKSSKRIERSQAERQAVNSTIQGSAADIAKKAMVSIDQRLAQVFPDRTPLLRDGSASHLILQVHDELIYEVAESNLDIVMNVVKNEMENTIQLCVPLPVNIKVGKSWGELKKITL